MVCSDSPFALVVSGTPVGSDHSKLMIVPDSEFPQRNVSGFSTIVGMIGHTKACLIIDKQWNGRSRLNTK